MKINVLAALIFLTQSVTLQAQPWPWEFAGWYGGGYYPDVAFDPQVPGRVYLASDVAGLWRSDDAGETWRFATQGLDNLNVAVLAAVDSNLVYAGTADGLFVSRNAGESWQACAFPDGKIQFASAHQTGAIAIDEKSPRKVCVGTSKGAVFCSRSAGESWKVLGSPFNKVPVTALYFSPNQQLFAATPQGLARYSFRRQRWKILKNAPAPAAGLFILKQPERTVFAASKNFLQKSGDGGGHWQTPAALPVPEGGRITRFSGQELSGGGVRLVAIWQKDWDGGVLMSEDLGETWKALDQNFSPDAAANPTRVWARSGGKTASVKTDPHNDRVLFRTDWWGVWRSDDGGESWQEKIKGAPNTVGSDMVVDSQGRLYVATMDNGLLRSEDGGKSYRAVLPAGGYRKELHGHIWRVAVWGEQSQKILAASSPWSDPVNQLQLSENAGQSFMPVREVFWLKRPRVNTLWHEGYPRALAYDAGAGTFYAGIDGDDGGGLFISRDGAKSWKPAPSQPGSRRIYRGLAFDPGDSNRLFWGASGPAGGVYLSENGGTSWKHVLKELGWVFDLSAAPDGTVYAAGDAGGPVIYISRNRGEQWELLKRFPAKGAAAALAVHPQDSSQVAVSTMVWDRYAGGKIFLTRDRGQSWEEITGDLPNGPGAAALLFDPAKGYLYMSRYAGSVYRTRFSAAKESP